MAEPPASLIDLVMGLALAPAGQGPGNRFSVEGLALGPRNDGAFDIGIRKFEAASLRLASGPLLLEIEHIAVHELAAVVRIEEGKPRLDTWKAASAELSGVKIHGPLLLPGAGAARDAPATAWNLGPLAAAEGTLRAQIVDAHLLFDADVTVPIRHGHIDFKDATVEHVGPDSRMGVSRLGLYVDAPNGRSYLYQFPSAPIPGVEYERRGAMLGPWVTDRGKLQLQAFGEWLLRQSWGTQRMGVTEQARLLFERTAVSGEVQAGDGKFAAPGVEAELVGRSEGRNKVRVHSEAVGRGLSVEMASVSVRNVALDLADVQLDGQELVAALTLRLSLEGGQLRFAFDLPQMKVSGLRGRLTPE